MKKIFILSFLLILLVTSTISKSQSTDNSACLNSLTQANTLYEKAQFAEAVALIQPCIKSGALKNNLVDAYRLLGLCYQQLNDEANTNDAILNLLKVKLDYQQFPYNDPKEFTVLINKFSAETKLMLGIKTGFNYTLPNITKAYAIKPATIEISGNSGQFLGINGDYFFKNHTFALSSWLTYNILKFSETHTFNAQERLQYKQEQTMADFGVTYKYFPLKKARIMPYAALGMSGLFFVKGLSNIVYTNDFSVTKTENSRDMKNIANKILLNGVAEIGGSIKTGQATLSIGFQYIYSFSNTINTAKRYDDIEYILINQYVDSDVKLHNANIYLNYSFPVLWRVFKK